jgi:LysM repeat protein
LLVRALFTILLLALPFRANAADYVVRAGDTLSSIAARNHVSLAVLARVNNIANIDLIQIGRSLFIPTPTHTYYYRVRWGDTLLGIAGRTGMTIATIRSLNPSLGPYPLAGQWLKLCGPCGSSSAPVPTSGGQTTITSSSSAVYIVRLGDTLSSIAARYGVGMSSLMAANHLANPNTIIVGSRLVIPQLSSSTAPVTTGGYNPWLARSLIVYWAHVYGVNPALALAIGWQESGFNQTLTSSTGAIGVMQVEPYTGDHIRDLWGAPVDLYSIDGNIHAGVFWLARLISYYGGNERLAVAAYYQGTRSIGRHGFFQDTVQYVNDVMALESSFGG